MSSFSSSSLAKEPETLLPASHIRMTAMRAESLLSARVKPLYDQSRRTRKYPPVALPTVAVLLVRALLIPPAHLRRALLPADRRHRLPRLAQPRRPGDTEGLEGIGALDLDPVPLE